MNDFHLRLQSFPSDTDYTNFADSGFFLRNEHIVCFCCFFTLKDWQKKTPWYEHIINSPRCVYVVRTKGKNAIQKICSKQSNYICKVCFDKDIEIFYLPCQHAVTCSECSNSLNACPVCRAPLIKKLKIYF